MKELKKELKKVVITILEKSEKARANDNYLIYRTYRAMGWPTDLKDIAENAENRFGTITRIRRKAQETNPMLLPKRQITKLRKAREKSFRDMARGI